MYMSISRFFFHIRQSNTVPTKQTNQKLSSYVIVTIKSKQINKASPLNETPPLQDPLGVELCHSDRMTTEHRGGKRWQM